MINATQNIPNCGFLSLAIAMRTNGENIIFSNFESETLEAVIEAATLHLNTYCPDWEGNRKN